jgi:hypothetical protein
MTTTIELAKEAGIDYRFDSGELEAFRALCVAERDKELMAAGMEPFCDWPEFHYQGLGCGLEDRGITDRYEAAEYGWRDCEERMLELGPFYTATQLAAARLQGAEEERKRAEVFAKHLGKANLHIRELEQQLAEKREALESIALAGMSGSGQESEEGMRDWHARRAWEFIGIAARAIGGKHD